VATTQARVVLRHIRELVAAKAADEVPDGELLERFIRRNEEPAFEALLKRHGPMVLGVCRRVLHHRDDAEDAYQATFVVLARKAASIGKRASVGSWLYKVAYHVAVRARKQAAARRMREGSAPARTAADPLAEVTGRELLTLLDEELQNLPERYRAPLVHCYLEGQTRDEAARHLGCSESTVNRRLEQGKEQLRKRLARRGLTLPAALLALVLTEGASNGAIPPPLPAAALRSSTSTISPGEIGSQASASVAELANGVLRGMKGTKLKIATSLALAASLVVTSASAVTRHVLASGGETAAAGTEDENKPREKGRSHAAINPEDRDQMTVSGRVLDPEGKPIARAQVAIMTHRIRQLQEAGPVSERLGLANTDAEGRFRLSVRRASAATDYGAYVVVAAAKFGLGWQSLPRDAHEFEATVRLYPEQALRGRLVDLQGQPAAKVRVYLAYVGRKDGREEGDSVGFTNLPEPAAPWPAPVTTDERGHFVFPGLGRGLLAGIDIRDDRFARQTLHRIEISGEEATLTLVPPQVVEGRIVCEDTGKPVPRARLVVRGITRKENAPTFEHGEIAARADEHGRFRVNSFPGNAVAIWAFPAAGTPYLGVQKEVVWPKGAVKHELDIALARGVLVRGKVTEQVSGKPVANAQVDFWPQFADNPLYRPGIASGLWSTVETGSDGAFRIAVLPGAGNLTVRGGTPDHIQRELLYDHASGRIADDLGVDRQRSWTRWSVAGFQPIDFKVGATDAEVQITVRRGVTVKGQILDPEGKPVASAKVLARLPAALLGYSGLHPSEARDGRFELRGCDPEKTYPVYFLDAKNRLGALAEIAGKGDEPVTVKLAPCGSAAVRFVDADGNPKPSYRPNPFGLQLLVRPNLPARVTPAGLRVTENDMIWMSAMDPLHHSQAPTADAQGRLTLAALIPGARYRISERGTEKEFEIESGKTLKLPDIPTP
jgi:RNA polymerase sigma factor (sigma-70 family)